MKSGSREGGREPSRRGRLWTRSIRLQSLCCEAPVHKSTQKCISKLSRNTLRIAESQFRGQEQVSGVRLRLAHSPWTLHNFASALSSSGQIMNDLLSFSGDKVGSPNFQSLSSFVKGTVALTWKLAIPWTLFFFPLLSFIEEFLASSFHLKVKLVFFPCTPFMNKLSRERVKNTFKWIYVQPTSSSLEIDGLGSFKLRPLFLLARPPREQAVGEPGRQRRFILFWWTLGRQRALGSTCLMGEEPWSRCGPGRERLESQAARECVSTGGFCLTLLARSSPFCEAQMCVQWKSTPGMSSLPCHTGPQPGAWWWSRPTHFLKKPRGNGERIAHSTCRLNNNELQVQCK